MLLNCLSYEDLATKDSVPRRTLVFGLRFGPLDTFCAEKWRALVEPSPSDFLSNNPVVMLINACMRMYEIKLQTEINFCLFCHKLQ